MCSAAKCSLVEKFETKVSKPHHVRLWDMLASSLESGTFGTMFSTFVHSVVS